LSITSLNASEQVRPTSHKSPIRITREQFRALPEYCQAIALVYLRRGTGEVELIDDEEISVR